MTVIRNVVFVLLASASCLPVLGNELTDGRHRVWYVDGTRDGTGDTGSREAPFDTIQAAIEASAEGDTIRIMPGTYTGQVRPKDGQTLVGSGWHNTTIRHQGLAVSAAVNLAQRNGVTLKNLKVVHASGIAIMLGKTSNIRLEKVWADGPFDGMRADSADFTLVRDSKFTSDYDAMVLNGRNCLVERCELVTTGTRGDKSAPPGAFRTSCSSPDRPTTVTLRDCTLRVQRSAASTVDAYSVEVDAEASVILDNCHLILRSTLDNDPHRLVGIGTEQQGFCLVRAAIIRVDHPRQDGAVCLEQRDESVLQVDPAAVIYDADKTVGAITGQ